MMAHRNRPKKSTRSERSRKELIRQLLLGFLLLTIFTLLVVGIWYLTRLPQLTISSVDAEGGVTIDLDTVVEVVESELTGTYYKLIPRRFTYLYPKDAIEKRIKNIPRVKDVWFEKDNRTHLVVKFSEYQPFALWCGEDMQPESCLFIDDTGYAFAKAPPLRGGAFTRYYMKNKPPTVSQNILSAEELHETDWFIESVASSVLLEITSVWLDDRDAVYYINGGGELRTTHADAVDNVLANLQTILSSKEFDHLEPGNFEYIDLRYGNKVFVREDAVESGDEVAATSTSASDR